MQTRWSSEGTSPEARQGKDGHTDHRELTVNVNHFRLI
jgi:hypothetical protein